MFIKYLIISTRIPYCASPGKAHSGYTEYLLSAKQINIVKPTAVNWK